MSADLEQLIQGQRKMIRTLIREELRDGPGVPAGTYGSFVWDGRRIIGAGAATGTPIGVWATLDGVQTIPNGTGGGPGTDNVSFDTILYDTNAFWDGGTPELFTIPVAGAYHITYTVEWDISDAGFRESYFQHNAFDAAFSLQLARMVLPASPTDISRGTVVTSGTVIQASVGDTLILKVVQSSGGDLDVIEPSVVIYRIGGQIALL